MKKKRVETIGWVLCTPRPHDVIVDVGLDRDSFIRKQIQDVGGEKFWCQMLDDGYTVRRAVIKADKETTDDK